MRTTGWMASVLVAGVMAVAAGSARAEADCFASFADATNSPVSLGLTVKKASLGDGLALRVEVANTSAAPYSLTVCPDMQLCCVRGLHVLLGSEQTGLGLLDLCKAQKPQPHETFLPAGATFAFDLTIPPERIPQTMREAGREIQVKLCFCLSDGGVIHSPTAKVSLAK